MKLFFTLTLLAFLCQSVKATDYYFSSSSGDDSRSASQAKSSSTPWKSISKLNSIFSSLQPGDRVLFKRGDAFYGTIKITKSGTASAPIVLSTYGSGDKPVITGFVTLSSWTSLGSGRYETTHASLGSSLNMVTLNGEAKAKGRYPNSNAENKGYLTLESSGSGYIKDNELTSFPNWAGAELVVRSHHWVIDKVNITGHSGGTINYSPALTYTAKAGYGYFIQNDIRTLDQTGEWAYKASNKTLTMYSGSSAPGTVKASVLKELVYLYDQDNIVFDNLAFEGANVNALYLNATDNTKIQNCDIHFTGVDAVVAVNTNKLVIEGCDIANTNSMGIYLKTGTHRSIIRNNTIRNTGVMPGMGQNGSNTDMGIRANGNYNTIEYNTIENTGFCGIRFTGDYTVIKNNLINKFCFVKDDGGGIYTGSATITENYGRKIIGNIILNGIGAKEGTTNKVAQQASGIYLDNNSSGITITDNTVASCGKVGLYVHNAFKITILGNTIFNNAGQVMLNHDDINKAQVRYINMKDNIFFSKKADQAVAYFYTKLTDIASFGTIDSNYYLRPLSEDKTINAITGLYSGSTQRSYIHNLDTWKPAYDHDPASKKSPKTFASTVNPDDFTRFVYNASTSSQTISLSGTYVDAKNKSYSGSITLAPYASAVLIKTGESTESSDDLASSTMTAPAAPVVSITSPKSYSAFVAPASVRITASASDADGSITKVEFYAGSKLLATDLSAPYDWTWSSVPAGTYTLTAKAYDNSGKVTTSQAVSITVSASNIAPVVSITSPKAYATYSTGTSVRVTASASDADGSISKVEFYAGSMLLKTQSAAPYDWTYSNAPAGTYTLTAKAYDNNGKVTTSAPVTVTIASGTLSTVNTSQAMMSMDTTAVAREMRRVNKEAAAFNFSLYPNPAVSKVQLQFVGTASSQKANLVIYTAAGAVVRQMPVTLQGSGIAVDVTSLAPGTYFISLSAENVHLSKKLIKVD